MILGIIGLKMISLTRLAKYRKEKFWILTTLDYWKFKCSFIIFVSLTTSGDCDSRSKGADSPAGISFGSVNVKSVPIV